MRLIRPAWTAAIATVLFACGGTDRGDGSAEGVDATGADSAPTDGSGDSGTASTSGGATSEAEAGTGDPSSGQEEEGSGGVVDACTYRWTFDDCADGWEAGVIDQAAVGPPSWECGDPTGNPSVDGAHTGVWATSLSGDYNEEESSYLMSPSFSLADCPGATIYLTFAHVFEFGSGDGGTVQMSTDGGQSWMTVEPHWHGYCPGTISTDFSPPNGEPGFCDGDDEVWMHSLVSIDELGGESDLRIRFAFGSDGIIEDPGWYVDSVGVEAY